VNFCSRRAEVPLIAWLIKRDAPFYDATISPEAIDGLNRFAKAVRLVSEAAPYDRLVATQFRQLWKALKGLSGCDLGFVKDVMACRSAI
jgi:hypothetical protein